MAIIDAHIDRPRCRGAWWAVVVALVGGVAPLLTPGAAFASDSAVEPLASTTAATPRRTSDQVTSVVEIRVRTTIDAIPIADATVSVGSAGVSVETDVSGLATIRGVPPGHHTFRVRALGYAPTSVEVEVPNGRTVRISVTLTAAPLAVRGVDVTVDETELGSGATVVRPADMGPTVGDLPTALDRVPGVTMVRRGGPGSPATVQIRGSSADQVLVLLDGVALNSPITGEVDLGAIDLATIERVVVLGGARSARYGPRALGGVILLETRDDHGTAVEMATEVGAWGSRRVAGSVTGSGSESAWSASASGQWSESDGDFSVDLPALRGGGEGRRANGASEHLSGSTRLTGGGGTIRASLRLHASRTRRGSPGAIAQPSPSGRQSHDLRGGTLRIEARGAGEGAELLLGIQRQRSEYEDPTPPFGPAYAQDTRVTRPEASLHGDVARGPFTVRGGTELRRSRVRGSALDGAEPTLDEAGAWARIEATRELAGVQTELRLGGRADRHDLVDGWTVSPAVTASAEVGGTRLEVGWSNGFSPPGLTDLFFQEGVLVEPNAELGPERVRGETSASLRHRRSVSGVAVDARVAAYDADVHGMILWFPDHRFVWSPDNFDVVRRGVEAALSLEVAWRGLEHTLDGHVAWSEVEYSGTVLDGQVAYRPRLTADAGLRVAADVGSASLRANHVGSRRSAPGSALNTLPGYTMFDLGVSTPFGAGPFQARLDLLLSNLLDERASLLVDYPLPGRGWSIRLRLGPRSP